MRWSNLTNVFRMGWNHQLDNFLLQHSWCFRWLGLVQKSLNPMNPMNPIPDEFSPKFLWVHKGLLNKHCPFIMLYILICVCIIFIICFLCVYMCIFKCKYIYIYVYVSGFFSGGGLLLGRIFISMIPGSSTQSISFISIDGFWFLGQIFWMASFFSQVLGTRNSYSCFQRREDPSI